MKCEIDRGNRLNFQRFTISISFEDYEEAESFAKSMEGWDILKKPREMVWDMIGRYK